MRQSNFCYVDVKDMFSLDATFSRIYSKQVVDDLERAYKEIIPMRLSTIEMW